MIDLIPRGGTTWERLASRRLIAHSIQHEGLRRPVLLYAPRHLQGHGSLPLVIVFHGGASNPETIARMSAMHRVAERVGFIVAYPAGTKGASGLTWRPGAKGEARSTDDIRFARKLIADLEGRYDIDTTRIYAAGFSIGGSLVYELADVLADRIAAAAVVAGTLTVVPGRPVRPVPLIHIHGTQDRRVPFEGGRGPSTAKGNDWPPVQAGLDRWRAINGCSGEPQVTRIGAQGVTRQKYAGAADIELWLVQGGYHTWPGGLRETAQGQAELEPARGFSASETIWAFFAAHANGRALAIRSPAGVRRRPVSPVARRGGEPDTWPPRRLHRRRRYDNPNL